MFVPQWPSADDGSGGDNGGGGGADASGDNIDEMSGALEDSAAMNGDAKHDGGGGAPDNVHPAPSPVLPNAPGLQSDSDAPGEGTSGIELTHDPLTGSVSVAAAAAEADEAGEQCQLWSAANPSDATNDTGGIEIDADAAAFGDIWSTEAFALDAASPLKELLDSNHFGLADLLAQDELLQELRGCEARLVDYFGTGDAVAGLVECLMVEVPGNGSREGRERWCKEEEERRLRQPPRAPPPRASPTLSRSTVLDASSPRQNDPTVEARWNSPGKKSPPGEWLLGSSPNSIRTEMVQREEPPRTPEEEYDARFVRHPYMACEVLCSEVGNTLDVLVDGYVDELGVNEINDEDDSLLGDDVGSGELREVKMADGDDVGENDAGETSTNVAVPPRLPPPGPPPSLSPQMSPPKLPLKTPPATPNENADQPATPVSNKPAPRRRILDLLFAVLIDAPPATLDDRRAGYFEKVLNVLFRRRGQAMSDYMNTSLIVTPESTEMAKQILGNAGGAWISALRPRRGSSMSVDTAEGSAMIAGSSSYVSLSRQAHSPTSDGSDHDVATNGDVAGGMAKFPSPDAPPMLMCALFDHLHSYSIMHIVQRLLLPSPARQQHKDAKTDADLAPLFTENKGAIAAGDSEADGNKMDDGENATSAMNDQFMNALNQMNGPPPPLADDDDDDEEMDEDDPANHIFQCEWSERPRFALELLLKRLEGDTGSFLTGYGFPVGYDADQNRIEGDGDADSSREEEGEASLSCAQHASEVLVAIIQNSALDSPVMRTLAADPSLRRIVAPILAEAQPAFVPHESLMTCAMTVLESLVLQLGGYGAVAACAEEGEASPGGNARQDGGSASALIDHVPTLLTRLSFLLTHPVTETWTAPSQHKASRPLLGTSRLRILRLLEALVLLGDPAVDAALQGSDALEGALDLFWQFEWCSMLHQSAANLLVHVFEGGEGRYGLQEYFLGRCNLLGRLMDSFGDEVNAFDPSKAVNGSQANIPEGSAKSSVEEAMSSEMMLAMKKLYSEKTTSSMESEHGSEGSDPSDPAPVSEDDVESAMEKECQDGDDALIGEGSNGPNEDALSEQQKADAITPMSPQPQVPSSDQSRTAFRKGYMGHVIIICQALVHACNNTNAEAGDPSGNDDAGANAVDEAECLLRSPPSMDDVPDGTNFETYAVQSPVHEDNDTQSPNGSKKRKDRSPVRDGNEDDVKRPAPSLGSPSLAISSPISPISSVPSSPPTSALPPTPRMNGEAREVLSIDRILQRHPLYAKWQNFVSSSLASEMSVQSTPLGGVQNPTNELGGQALPSSIEDTGDSDFLGSSDQGLSGVGPIGGIAIAGGIDMDENDLDIAASMMEALSLPPAANGGASGQPAGHNRRRGVSLLGGGEVATEESSGIGNFGSVIQRPGGFKDYVYDDPLGGLHPFDGGDVEETNLGSGSGSSDDDDFMSDAMVVSRDGGVTKQGSEDEEKQESQGGDGAGDNEDDDEDDDVPVMDLFAGTFDANFADFDAFDSSPSTSDDPFKEENNNGSAEDAFTPIGTSSDDAADDFEFTKTPFALVDGEETSS